MINYYAFADELEKLARSKNVIKQMRLIAQGRATKPGLRENMLNPRIEQDVTGKVLLGRSKGYAKARLKARDTGKDVASGKKGKEYIDVGVQEANIARSKLNVNDPLKLVKGNLRIRPAEGGWGTPRVRVTKGMELP
jgi:hypothetical protein